MIQSATHFRSTANVICLTMTRALIFCSACVTAVGEEFLHNGGDGLIYWNKVEQQHFLHTHACTMLPLPTMDAPCVRARGVQGHH